MREILNWISRLFTQMFTSASQQATEINTLFFQFLILAGIIVLIVAGLVIASIIRFRSNRRPDEPSQREGSTRAEFIWTMIPLLLLVGFFVITVKGMKEINRPYEHLKPDIIIIAHQWWWDMRYPQYNVITANELHVPIDKNLLTQIESADVIHSWWVPDLGRKMDAIPGRLNYIWIDADKAGEYHGQCSEYCGVEHAWMRILVIAESPSDFDKWIHEQQQVPPVPTDSLAHQGYVFFQHKPCGSCHTIAGTPADAHMAPDLTHVASRQTLLSGMVENTKENLTRWLENPQKVKKGANMPNFMLSKHEIQALVTYLEGLK